MRKYQRVAINIAILTIIFSAGVINSSLAVLGSDSELNLDVNNKKITKYSQEKQEKILNTFEKSDYQAWQKIVGQNNKVGEIIDESTFNNFITARTAARNGQYNKAIKITEELKKKVGNNFS
ncbi:MAG: hypothetical protein WAW11_01165 [Patescibacteria group bacterium]